MVYPPLSIDNQYARWYLFNVHNLIPGWHVVWGSELSEYYNYDQLGAGHKLF